MKVWTRRNFIYASASLPIISCSQVELPIKINSPIKPIKSKNRINEEIRLAKNIMNKEIPGSVELEKEAKGVLIIPTVSEANFWLGGAFGEGGLLIGKLFQHSASFVWSKNRCTRIFSCSLLYVLHFIKTV